MVFEEVHLAAKQQIIKAGDSVDTIYLIAQGEVEIYQVGCILSVIHGATLPG